MLPQPDGVDRLLLEEAAACAGRPAVVLEDPTGALATSLPDLVGVCCDALDERRATADALGEAGRDVPVVSWPDAALLANAGLVVARLPKSLSALDELAERVAAYAPAGVTLLAGGRVKHMTRGMNDVLGRHFDTVRASLGRHKSRVLVATGPRPAPLGHPQSERHDDLDLTVCAHGGVFAGTGVDVGTRFLLSTLDRLPAGARDVVDLGCGTGVLAVAAARVLPGAQVRAIDVSAAAVRSAAATAAANGLSGQVTAAQVDGLEGMPPASLDLVLLNPPFHRGTALDTTTAPALFGQVGGRLRAGGELWVVWNSHLPYLPALRQRVGSTMVVAQNPRFTVTRSVRRG